MKTISKKISDTRVEIKVVLDEKDLSTARKKAIEHLAKEIKVQGFRKGKVPASVAEKNLDPNEINNAALEIAIRSTIPAAFEEAKESPLMMPEVNVIKYVPNDTAEYTATADILPDIKLGAFKNLKVKKVETKASQKDIDEVIENIKNAYAEKKAAKKKAAMGDEVIIDFVGKKDGKAFDGGTAKDFALSLGSKQFIPGFEEGIVGHESGDKFELDLAFPKDYHNKDLAGKKTVFEVLLKQVNELKKPAEDDDLAKKCGPFKTMAELKADIKKNLEMQNEHKANEKYKNDLVDALVAKSKIPVPEILISDQLHYIKDDISRNAASRGMSFDNYLKQIGQTEKEWEKEAKKVAETRVRASLALQVLAKEQKITVDDSIVDAKITELRDVYQKSPEAIKNLKEENVRQEVKNRLIIEKTLEFLVKSQG